MGETETMYRAWIQTMEPLSPERAATAEVIYRLAAQVDRMEAEGKTDAAIASVARALLVSSAKFQGVPMVIDPALAETTVKPIQSVRDELASRRRGKEVS